jgi:hypothetical protein
MLKGKVGRMASARQSAQIGRKSIDKGGKLS